MEIHTDLSQAPPYTPIKLQNLFNIAEWYQQIPWKPFRDGVQIHRLYGDGVNGPTAALIRYEKAGEVPLHRHTGYEHIIVLSGAQSDQNGTATAGSLVINQPGTEHRIVSDSGCIVLVIYEKPVVFVEEQYP
ncbi:MAG: cupin domain-containing protein [Candidatus Methylacidiphilales bacterium]|nr:cupin domain-containing protein [Candidatus Methylacidiphilales bacterium]